MKLIIAEKPSVARDLAQALGVKSQGRGSFRGKDFIITWAIGHLVTLAEPHQINPIWQKWRESDLPILPSHWPLSILDNTAAQFNEIKTLLHLPEVTSIIAATDAGREGELIFRYIYEKAEATKPVERLWLSSLTQESIAEAFRTMKPLASYDRLADNARGRSRSDWLVGLNFSRAYSLKNSDRWTVGRVQTPTLAMVVERTESVQSFVPETYLEIEAFFETEKALTYRAFYVDAKVKKTEAHRFKVDDPLMALVLGRAKTGRAVVKKRDDKEQKVPPPKLYDLTELQKDANRLYGFQAKQTLDLAQSLYESHKLITYPRSDSRYLSVSVAKSLPEIVQAVRAPYESFGLHPATGTKPLGKDFVDDKKVSDHHAIIPTGKDPSRQSMSGDEAKVFDLIVKRLLMAWQDDHVRSQSVIHTVIKSELNGKPIEDDYRASGSIVLADGWKKLERRSGKTTGSEALALPLVQPGEAVKVKKCEALKKETKPPAAFSDATLLNGMASAGSRLDDKELTDILRERGLGTPATRAATIENLIHRGYVERREKALWATPLGIKLIHQVHPSVRSAALTGEWEAKLRKIEDGALTLVDFTHEIEEYVKETITMIKSSPVVPSADRTERQSQTRQGATADGARPAFQSQSKPQSQSSPVVFEQQPVLPPMSVKDTLFKAFGHKEFRQHQEQICKEIIEGNDLLLVMPTGAGKSLCYQLPALVMQGCTIVVSPLIALMDDQVQKLQAQGINAAALHSGLSRETSRAICREYQEGTLKLLYVAPERLGLSGFLEFLAQTPPALVAIDEAHCISQWGHDFRPDYRMLAQRLLRFRPAPIVAMTATATPLVQKDIVNQLDLRDPKLHIHGFRRTNIAIEITEVALPDRPLLIRKLVSRPTARPAIVYAPTRKDTEALSEALSPVGNVSPYHAGLSHEKRQQIQRDFQAGKLDVIVATIAFGMGIDKSDIRTVIHAALPSSVEAYYQEIGRAGRDGKFSRAILLHSYADHRTREFFIKKNYPDIKVLESVLKKIPSTGIERPAIRASMDASSLDNALEKLWIHGAIEIDGNDEVRSLGAAWQKSYLNQQIHKEAEVSLMSNFAQNQQSCRMLLFLHHFGDQSDKQTSCGLCDFCLPLGTLSKTYRKPTGAEQTLMLSILSLLKMQMRPLSISKVFQQLETEGLVDERRVFDAAADALVRHGLAQSRMDSFEKEGQSISYRTLAHAQAGDPIWDDLLILEAQVGEARLTKRKGASARGAAKSSGGSSASRNPGKTRQGAVSAADMDDPVAQKLRGWRIRMAKQEKVPAYRIFSDRTLAALVSERPRTSESLKEIDGIGPIKFDKYGHEILKLLTD
ncbi:MAG: DNA topoisomerase 3 [Chitinophagaceae bacterium]|nr:DNA topoisomerase 3 [Oligoflexus sp.]